MPHTKRRLLPKILAIDDEQGVIASLKVVFEDDYRFFSARNAEGALAVLDKYDIQLIILDLGLPDMPGLQLFKKIKEISPDIECVVLTANTELTTGIEAMKLGAYDYLVKPFDVDHISLVVRKAIEKSKLWAEVRCRRMIDTELPQILVGKDPQIEKVYELIDQVAKTDVTVLITGESGTGKEVVARAIHNLSERYDAPFVPVNCGAIPSELTESEFFGHEKGAFTGATGQKLGKFEIAQHGTIFLDEISTLPFNLQAKLLRVLQERTIERVGGTRQIPVDVRIIAATNRDLKTLIESGKFRDDLFYRLNIVPIHLPPLRERKSDISLLVKHFLAVYNQKYHKEIKELPEKIMDYFIGYDWPGNVRELENIIQRLLVTSSEGATLSIKQLPLEMIKRVKSIPLTEMKLSLAEALRQFERDCIEATLVKTNYRHNEAAELLGIHRNTLVYKMKQLGLTESPDAVPSSD